MKLLLLVLLYAGALSFGLARRGFRFDPRRTIRGGRESDTRLDRGNDRRNGAPARRASIGARTRCDSAGSRSVCASHRTSATARHAETIAAKRLSLAEYWVPRSRTKAQTAEFGTDLALSPFSIQAAYKVLVALGGHCGAFSAMSEIRRRARHSKAACQRSPVMTPETGLRRSWTGASVRAHLAGDTTTSAGNLTPPPCAKNTVPSVVTTPFRAPF
jgi:hypothetical protein